MIEPLRSTLKLPSIQKGLSVTLMVHSEGTQGLSATVTHDKTGAEIAFICAHVTDCHFEEAYDGNWELWMCAGCICLPVANAAKAAKFLGIPFPSRREAA